MKKILGIAALILAVFIIQGLVVSILSLWQKQDVIKRAEQQLQAAQQQNHDLKSKLKQVGTSEFIEDEARDKLFLAKPGENQVILPPASSSTSVAAVHAKKSNIEQWLALFFYQDQD